MFKILDVVATKNSGICRIIKEETFDFGTGPKKYFTLEPLYKERRQNSLVVRIPQDNAYELMRPVLTEEQVKQFIPTFPSIKPLMIFDARLRKQNFYELYQSGDLKDQVCIIKSLYLISEELKNEKKHLSFQEKEYFTSLVNNINDEFAYALKISPEQVDNYIKEQLD